MGDGYKAMGFQQIEEVARLHLDEARTREQEGKGSLLSAISSYWSGKMAGNDTVTGVLGNAIEELATRAGSGAAGTVLGNIPVDGIAETLGHAAGGDTNEASWAYGKAFVSGLAGFTASAGAKSALVGATAPAWATTAAVIGAGIGAAYLAKKGMEYLRNSQSPKAVPGNRERSPGTGRPATPAGTGAANPPNEKSATASQSAGLPPAQPQANASTRETGGPGSQPTRQTGTLQGNTGTCRMCGASYKRPSNDNGLCMKCTTQVGSQNAINDYLRRNPNFGKAR
jgi:hypothetical protein